MEWACFRDPFRGRLDRPGIELIGHGHDPLLGHPEEVQSIDDHLVNQYFVLLGGTVALTVVCFSVCSMIVVVIVPLLPK